MSFFIRTGNTIKDNEKCLKKERKREKGKRKRFDANSKRRKQNDEDIDSDDEEINSVEKETGDLHESEDEYETAQEKKLRLAKLYLEEIQRKEKRLQETGEVGKDIITDYLKEELKDKANKNRRAVADSYEGYKENVVTLRCKEHRLPVTCVVLSFDSKFIYSGSKDSGIVKWSLHEGKKLKSVKSKQLKDGKKKHLGIILCLAISSDSKFLVSGSSNKEIHVWNPESLENIHTFLGHKGPVTGLAFQRNHLTLFSASADRCVKVWNLTEMTYVESLFGHQKGVTAVDAFIAERAITSGEDNSVHLWKIVEESQLIYNANGGVDGVKFINESFFLTCGSDGSLCLWGVLKKRPLFTVVNAHGIDETNDQPHWLSSISSLKNTDLIASGSCSGAVKLWKCSNDFKKLEMLFSIPVKGFINGIDFSQDGQYIVVAVGSEHRLGRWKVMDDVINCVLVIPLNKRT